LVVDDFAHHPTAVRATIEAARGRWPKRRLWAILEPRSNSMRRKVFQESLPKALALADRVVLGGVFRAQQLGDENRMDPESWLPACANWAARPGLFLAPMPLRNIFRRKQDLAISC